MPRAKITQAVLADAGYATRFLPITKTLPKSMLPILDKPITQYFVEECMQAGIRQIIIVATEEGKAFYEDYFHNAVQHIYKMLKKQKKASRFNKISEVFSLPSIVVIAQDKKLPYGNGTPLVCAHPYLKDDPFLYVFTDDLVIGKSCAQELIEEYNNAGDVDAVIAVKDMPGIDVTKYGMVKLKKGTKNQLDYIIEKPSKSKSPSNMVSFGRYLLTPKIFEYLSPDPKNLGKDKELWIVDAIAKMAKRNKVIVKTISGEWTTTGDPRNYLQTVIKYALSDPEFNGEFKKFLKSLV